MTRRCVVGLTWIVVAGGALLAGACGGGEPVPPIPDGCNPISLDSCYLPYPSAFYQVADGTTATGVRMQFPAGFLPNSDGVAFEPRRLMDADGASPATPIVVYFQAGVDVGNLPTLGHEERSVAADSPVVVVDETGERVAFFLELDANTDSHSPADQQALIIRPLRRLKPATHYLVAIRAGVNDASGLPLAAPQPFRSLRDHVASGRAPVKALVDHYEQLFTTLAAAGVTREDLVLAWDFVTASDESITGPLLAMRDDALARVAAGGYGYTIDEVKDHPDARLLRQVTGTFDVPWYLEGQG